MVLPPDPWPSPPTLEGHRAFELKALLQQGKPRDWQPFFCRGLPEAGTARQIMTAAVTGDAQAMKAALDKQDCLPDFANANGISPLMVACARGNKAVADMLAAHPLVQLDRQSRDGWTALHYAVWMRQKDVMTMLLDHLASPVVENSSGKSPYALACEQESGEVFLKNRAFRQFMKRHDPSVLEPEKPEPAPAPEEEPARAQETPETTGKETPAEDSVFKQRMAQLIVSLGMGWKLPGDEKGRQALYTRLAGLNIKHFKASFEGIEETRKSIKTDFNWQMVFIAAAKQGNVEVMRELHRIVPVGSEAVQKALYAAIAEKDNPDAVHHLMVWGADVTHGQSPASASPMMLAIIRNQPEAFEEMATWNEKQLDGTAAKKLRLCYAFARVNALKIARDGSLKPASQNAMRDAARFGDGMTMLGDKDDMRGKSGKKLKAAFALAVAKRDPVKMAAAYAESRRERFFSGTIDMPGQAGNDAIAIALLYHKFNLARRLASDGYELDKASPAIMAELRSEGSEKARDMARKLLEGKIDLTPIEKIRPQQDYRPPPIYFPRGHI